MPVGPDWYAIELARVREVVAMALPALLPAAPATLLGVFNLRGDIVPMFDTAALLGIGVAPPPSHVTVVETLLGPAGLAASVFPESVDLGDPLGAAEIAGGVATYAVGTRVATLIDVDVLLTPANIGRGGS